MPGPSGRRPRGGTSSSTAPKRPKESDFIDPNFVPPRPRPKRIGPVSNPSSPESRAKRQHNALAGFDQGPKNPSANFKPNPRRGPAPATFVPNVKLDKSQVKDIRHTQAVVRAGKRRSGGPR